MSDPCDYEIQILLIDGTCETCFFYEHPDEDGKECVSDDCAGDQVLIEDGTCKQCDPGFIADDLGKNCVEGELPEEVPADDIPDDNQNND